MSHSTLPILSLNTPGQTIESYVQTLKAIPLLTPEEERAHAVQLREHDDNDAARTLVMSHLRFVVHIAHSYRGYGLPHADLIQEGNIGLMKAIKRFDPNVGVRLVSFAVHWIRAEIHEYILRNWRIVKVATTKAQRKLFFNLRGKKKNLGWLKHAEVQKVAEDLGVTPRDVLEMESRLSGHDMGFDGPKDSDDESDQVTPATYLEDIRFEPEKLVETAQWKAYGKQQLNNAMQQLDDRSEDIIRKRWLGDEKQTLQELAGTYSVSAERIRQVEQTALSRIKKNLSMSSLSIH
ncbi:RNA polymerase sigma factor RpoH [Candidatus Venteria ishoeyi]|uniref:RNA polymerase sigma factor RpoH n=1 Tax=Candidatus Venteria ishoeyi TaxID=1899563 RepID=A0A1H6FGX1_9GAMM|nr:RNA polymerase sigma factor RpoH [Candidatus Venteria ishoeyi]MDM8548107.1 RNA polymerase sigma factor RpoH [Candidatus Venteria ishoeyi]SEH09193.1 RNA polymerase sigma factor RpoH [Candidatus Venteria ishoeyi]SEH09318.1 RNA polymerase sigma factor RpoH [Candidatus Venteria ishoeyi]